jgi:hypothetical protein
LLSFSHTLFLLFFCFALLYFILVYASSHVKWNSSIRKNKISEHKEVTCYWLQLTKITITFLAELCETCDWFPNNLIERAMMLLLHWCKCQLTTPVSSRVCARL